MANIRFHLLNLFQMLYLLLLISTAQSASPPAQQNASASQQTDASSSPVEVASANAQHLERGIHNDVTQEEIRAVDGNIQAVFIVRGINRRAKTLNTLVKEAKDMVNRQFGYQIVPKLGKLISRIRTSSLKDLWKKSKEIIGWEKTTEMEEVPKTPEQFDKEKREQMNTPEFWMDLLKTCRLTDAQLAKLKDDLAGALTDEPRQNMYFAQMDKMKETFAQIFGNLESEMIKQVDQMVVERQQQQQQSEIIEEEPSQVSVLHPRANLFQKCDQIYVESVNLLDQIRLEIQLHHYFQKLPMNELSARLRDHLEDYESKHAIRMKEAKKEKKENEARRDEKEFCQSLLELMDLSNAIGNLHSQLLPNYQNALVREGHYLTPILEVAQVAEFTRETHKESRDQYWMGMENLVEIWHIAAHLVFPKRLSNELKAIHKVIYTELEMPKEWFLEVKAVAMQAEVVNKMSEEILTAWTKIALAHTLLLYERLNAFYKIDHFHQLWIDGQFPNNDIGYNHLNLCFDKDRVRMVRVSRRPEKIRKKLWRRLLCPQAKVWQCPVKT